MRFTLRNKLLVFSILLALVPVIIAGRALIQITADELKNAANDEIGNTVREVADQFDEQYQNAWLTSLVVVRNAVDNPALGVPEKAGLLRSGIRDIPDLVALQLTAEGAGPVLIVNDTYAAELRAAGQDVTDALRVDPASLPDADTPRSLGIEPTPGLDDWLLTLLLPLENPLNGRAAVLTARLSLRSLEAFVENHGFNRGLGQLTILRSAEEVVAGGAEGVDWQNYALAEDALTLVEGAGRAVTVEPYTRPDGTVMLGAFASPAQMDLAVLAELNEDDAYKAIGVMEQSLLLWMLIGLAVAVVFAIVFALGISRPVEKIGLVAEQVSTGDLQVRVEGVKSRDEIGDLAQRINEMIQGLHERFNLLKFVSEETEKAVVGAGAAGSDVKLGGERRRVTVFFSDIRGFTAFSEGVEPEVVIEMLNTYLSEQATLVKQFGGDIDKYVGDELVAVFQGETMAEDAVRCALAIQEKMREIRQHADWPVAIGIGINTGEVVMGAMGSEERMDYTILGDTVNLGARLCSAAGHHQVLISQHTEADLENVDDLWIYPLDPINLKGKAEPVPLYEVKAKQATSRSAS